MAVEVATGDDFETFNEGVKWFIDTENNILHIINEDGKHIGAFTNGAWSYVRKAEDDMPDDGEHNTVINVQAREDAATIARRIGAVA